MKTEARLVARGPWTSGPQRLKPIGLSSHNAALKRCSTHPSAIRVSRQPPSRTVGLGHRFRGNLFRHEGFDHVADFDVAVIRDRNTALHAVGDLRGVVFEAAQ